MSAKVKKVLKFDAAIYAAGKFVLPGPTDAEKLWQLAERLAVSPFLKLHLAPEDLVTFDTYLAPPHYLSSMRPALAGQPKGVSFSAVMEDLASWVIGDAKPVPAKFTTNPAFMKASALGGRPIQEWVAIWESFCQVTKISESEVCGWMEVNSYHTELRKFVVLHGSGKWSFDALKTTMHKLWKGLNDLQIEAAAVSGPVKAVPAAAAQGAATGARVAAALAGDQEDVSGEQEVADVIAAAEARGFTKGHRAGVKSGLQHANAQVAAEKKQGGHGPSFRGGQRKDGANKSMRSFFAAYPPVRTNVCSSCGSVSHGACQSVVPVTCHFCKNYGHTVGECKHPGAVQALNKYNASQYPVWRRGAPSATKRVKAGASAGAPAAASPEATVGAASEAAVDEGEQQTATTPLFTRVWLGAGRVPTVACVDSGSNRVCIESATLQAAHPGAQLRPYKGDVGNFQGGKGAPPLGETDITMAWTEGGTPVRKVTALVFKQLMSPLLIGTDLMLAASFCMKVNKGECYVKFDGVKLQATVLRQERVKARCFAARAVVLSPNSIEAQIPVKFYRRFPTGVASVWPTGHSVGEHTYMAAAVYTVAEGERVLPATVMCMSDRPVRIKKGAHVADIYSDVVGGVTVAGASFPAVATDSTPDSRSNHFVALAAAATAHVPEEGKQAVWEAILAKLKDMDPELTDTQRKQAEALFWHYRDQFVLQLEGAGAADLPPHRINLVPGAAPPRIPVLRLSPAERALLWKELDSLLRMEAVRAAGATAFNAPMLLVEKPNSPIGPDGRREMRVVIDYRGLNKITQQEHYPLPLRQEVLDKLGKAAYFTTFDLASGYYQMPVAEEDRHKTGFTVPGRGVFEWNVTAMGLMNAPPSFQRAMEVVLSGLNWICCLVFIDDVIIFSASWEDHLRDVAAVLERFAGVGLKVKITKCQIARTSVKFLGAVVSRAGVSPDPARVAAIVEARAPKSLAETRRFLGLCGWLRDFGGVHFAAAVQPLYDTLRKRKNWVWTPEAELGFARVKELLASAPILCHPDFTRPFVVYADASDDGHGGILFQQQANGVGGVIAYHSGRWSDAERKYSTSQMETLTLGILCKEWRPYLYGSNFDVWFYSDHQPVKAILEGRNYDHGRLDRVRAELQDFAPRMKVQYIKGTKNPADALTREPVLIAPLHVEINSSGHPTPIGVHVAASSSVARAQVAAMPGAAAVPGGAVPEAVAFSALTTAAQLLEAQKADPEIAPYLVYCETGAIPGGLSNADRKGFKEVADRMGRTADGVLFIKANVPLGDRVRRGEGAIAQIVTPASYRKDLLHTFHERLGHLKAERLADLLRRYYWWPSLHRDVSAWVAECADCQRTQSNRKDFGSLHPHGADRPFQVVALDLATCGDGDGGFKCFIVIVDLFSKWVEGRPLPNGSEDEVLRAVDELWVSRFGPAEIFLSDNGQNLIGGKMKAYCAERNIKHVTVTEYHPQANGQAEHAVKMVKGALLAAVSLHQKDWPRHFSTALSQIRMAKNSSTGMSPYFLMFGRAPTLPVPAPLRALREAQSAEEVAASRALDQARNEEVVRQNLEVARAEMKARYDARHTPAAWSVGDMVWKRRERALPGEVRALQPEWEGPFVIKSVGESDNLVVYLAANPDQEKRATSDQLKPYRERSDQRVEAPVAEDVFEVEEIWQEAPLGEGRQYLVKWKGYPPSAMTWEPEGALAGNELLARFRQRPEQERRVPPRGKTVPKKVRLLQAAAPVAAEPILTLGGSEVEVRSRSGRKLRVPEHQKAMIYLGAANAQNLFAHFSRSQLALRA